MPRPPALPVQDKTRIVLAVLAKEKTVAEAARHAGVSEQSVANWRRQFVEGGIACLEGSAPARPSDREQLLSGQVSQLKTALGEAYVELMALRKLRSYRGVPTRTSS